MKQTSFVVEIIVKDDKTTFIFRANNGAIANISDSPAEANSFLESVVEKLVTSSNS